MKHHIWMLLACILPLLLVFVLPGLGVSSNGLFTLLIIGCFAMHIFMMRGHGHGNGKGGDKNDEHRH